MNNQRSGGIAPHPTRPKIFVVQKSTGKVLASNFFWVKPTFSSLIIFQMAKLSTHSIIHLCCCWKLKDILEGKTPTAREVYQVGIVLAQQCSCSPVTCNPQETGLPGLPKSWSPTLFSRHCPVGLPSVPGTENQLKIRHFFVRRWGHCCYGDVVGRTEFWIFFLVSSKSCSNELRSVLSFVGGICWINTEFCSCSLFPSWSG
jgi:hypothetical protein